MRAVISAGWGRRGRVLVVELELSVELRGSEGCGWKAGNFSIGGSGCWVMDWGRDGEVGVEKCCSFGEGCG